MVVSVAELSRLSDVQIEQLESFLFEFERVWTPKQIEQSIADLPSGGDGVRRMAVSELVKIDIERCWQLGTSRVVEDYLELLPELGTRETVAPDLIQTEAEVRAHLGDPLSPQELRQRFPARAKELSAIVNGESPSNIGDKSVETHVTSISDSISDRPSGTPQPADSESLPETFGRYRIEKQLGQGAMGAVYLAHDTQLNRRVALKTPTFDTSADAEMVERFYREARAAANLRHAGICPVFDVGEIDGIHYISMAYIEGKPLSGLVNIDKPLPIRTAVSLVRKIALALDNAHRQGVIHRDLKPANIMIDREKQPLIMDFGLARELDKQEQTRLTQDGMILGTPAYMSPEQVEGDLGAGKTADVYSLGVILYELLTGDVPYQGTVAAVIGQIMTQDAPPPSRDRGEVDAALDAICQKMMARKVEDRYAGMKEAADALTDYLRTGGKKTSSQSASSNQAAALKTVTEDEGLAAFLATASKEEFPVVPPHRDGAVTQLLDPWKKLPARTKVIATSVLAGLLLVMSVVFMFPTANGTIRVEVMGDEDVEVLIDGKSIKLTDGKWSDKRKADEHRLALKIGGQQIPFDAKSKTFRLADGSVSVNIAGVAIAGGKFEVLRGDKTAFTIEVIRPSGKAGLKPPTADDLVPPIWPTAGTASLELVQTFDDVTLQSVKGRNAGYDNFALAFWPNDAGQLRIMHSMNRKGHAELLDVATKQNLPLPLPLPEGISSATFSDDGTRLLVGTERDPVEVTLWDLANVKTEPLLRLDAESTVFDLQFDSSGHIVAEHGPQKVRVSKWRADDGKELARFQSDKLPGYGTAIVAVSTDGNQLVFADRTQWAAERFDVQTGERIAGKLPEHKAMWMAYSPAGKYLATWSYDRMAVVSDAKSGKEVWRLKHQESLSAAAFSPDDRFLVTGTYTPRKRGIVTVWDLESGAMVAEGTIPVLKGIAIEPAKRNMLQIGKGVFAREIAFAPDGQYFALAAAGAPLTVWKIEEKQPETLFKPREIAALDSTARTGGFLNRVGFWPDGQHVLDVEMPAGNLRMRNVVTGKVVEDQFPAEFAEGVTAFAFSTDGQRMVVACLSKDVWIWNLNTKAIERKLRAAIGPIGAVAFSDKGQAILGQRVEGTFDVFGWPGWQDKAPRRLPRFRKFPSYVRERHRSVAFAPDELRLESTAGTWKFNRVDPEWQNISTYEQGGWFRTCVTISADGRHVVVGSAADGRSGKVEVRSAGTAEPTVFPTSNIVRAVAISADSRWVAASALNIQGKQRLYVWDRETKEVLAEWKSAGSTQHLEFSPDGKQLLAAGPDMPLTVWTLEENGPSPILLAAPMPDQEAQRAAVTAFLKRSRVWITVEVGGESLVLTPGDKLPEEPFTVTNLYLDRGGVVTEEEMSHVAAFPALKSLRIRFCQLSDDMLQHVGRLSQLEFLDLINTRFSDAGLAHLKGLRNLKGLVLAGTEVSDAGLQHLVDMQLLYSLNLSGTNVTGQRLTDLKSLRSLKRVTFGGPNFTEKRAAIDTLKEMTGLKILGLHSVKFTDSEKDELEKAIPQCSIRYHTVELNLDEPINENAAARKVAEDLLHRRPGVGLSVQTDEREVWVNSREKLPQVPFIVLTVVLQRQKNITTSELEKLAEFRSLRWLDLYFTRKHITDEKLKPIGKLTSLTGLRLNNTEIGDAGMKHLAGLTELRTLTLHYTDVGDAGVSQLVGLKHLVQLSLNDTPVTDASVPHLKQLTSLRKLNLVNTKVTKAGIDEIKKAIPKCKIYTKPEDVPPEDADDLEDNETNPAAAN